MWNVSVQPLTTGARPPAWTAVSMFCFAASAPAVSARPRTAGQSA